MIPLLYRLHSKCLCLHACHDVPDNCHLYDCIQAATALPEVRYMFYEHYAQVHIIESCILLSDLSAAGHQTPAAG